MKVLLTLLATTAFLQARILPEAEIKADCVQAAEASTNNSYKRAIAQGIHPAYALSGYYNELILNSKTPVEKKQDLSDTLIAIFQRGHGWGGFSKQKANANELNAAVEVLRTLSITADDAQREIFKAHLTDASIAAHYSVVDAVLSVGGTYKKATGEAISQPPSIVERLPQWPLYQRIAYSEAGPASIELDYALWNSLYDMLPSFHSTSSFPAAGGGGSAGASAMPYKGRAMAGPFRPGDIGKKSEGHSSGTGAAAIGGGGSHPATSTVSPQPKPAALPFKFEVDSDIFSKIYKRKEFEDAKENAAHLEAQKATKAREKDDLVTRKATIEAELGGSLEALEILPNAIGALGISLNSPIDANAIVYHISPGLDSLKRSVEELGLTTEVHFMWVEHNILGWHLNGTFNFMVKQIKSNFEEKYGIDYDTAAEKYKKLLDIKIKFNKEPSYKEREEEERLKIEEKKALLASHFGNFENMLKYKYQQALTESRKSHGNITLFQIGLNNDEREINEFFSVDMKPISANQQPGTYIEVRKRNSGSYQLFKVTDDLRLTPIASYAGFEEDRRFKTKVVKPEWAELIRPIIQG